MPSRLEDYESLYQIGSGSYGKCKKIKRKRDDKILVWKQIDYGCMTESEKQLLVSEVNLLRELKHKHIVRYYDRIIDRHNSTIYIVMEYCEGGDLASLISRCRKESKHMDESFVWRILGQVTMALRECHRRRGGRAILHRDLKPANVFLDSSQNVKLGDFGLARELHHETSFAQTFVGTPYYMSPEQMNHASYNDKSDIWSLGCMTYELCSLHPPFTATNQKELTTKIQSGYFCRIPRQYSKDLNDVISKMLVQCEKRPTIEELAHTPQFVKHTSSTPQIATSEPAPELDKQQLKEKALKEKEKQLQNFERTLLEKERSLLRKEMEVDVKIKRAESLLKEVSLQKRDRLPSDPDYDTVSKPLTPCLAREKKFGSPPKRVHFNALRNVQNLNPLQIDIFAHNECKTNADNAIGCYGDIDSGLGHIDHYGDRDKIDTHIGRYGDLEDYGADYQKRLELRDRLSRAKARSEYLRKAEFESKYRSRELLGMR